MGKNKKTISFVLLLLSFTLILADCNLFPFPDSPTIKTCNTSPDISNHFEQSHSHGADDNVIINETNSKTPHLFYRVDYVFTADINIKSNFISSIWQPPKLS